MESTLHCVKYMAPLTVLISERSGGMGARERGRRVGKTEELGERKGRIDERRRKGKSIQ